MSSSSSSQFVVEVSSELLGLRARSLVLVTTLCQEASAGSCGVLGGVAPAAEISARSDSKSFCDRLAVTACSQDWR